MIEDGNNLNNIEEQQTKNCKNCIYFEERTCFCRLNPPTPMPSSVNGNQYMTSVYPKISFPEFDFCHQFKQK